MKRKDKILGIVKGSNVENPIRHKYRPEFKDEQIAPRIEYADIDAELDVRDHVGRKSDNTQDDDI